MLSKIPIRTIDFKNKTDKAIHDKIVSLQKKLIAVWDKMDCNHGNRRKLIPLRRQFINIKSKLVDSLRVLYGLGENDNLIPSIHELYEIK